MRILFYLLLALVFLSDFFVERGHGTFLWDNMPGFSALFGFISCVIIMALKKFLGHALGLMKKEDYYD